MKNFATKNRNQLLTIKINTMKKIVRQVSKIKSGVMEITLMAGAIIILFAFAPMQQATSWVAPKEADALKNPVKDNAAATAEGKKLYVQYCTICHGGKGKGDGAAGIALTPKPGNFTTQKMQAQTDGAIFWKLTNGRPPMAAYKDILKKEEQRWQLVNYIRTLAAPVKKK